MRRSGHSGVVARRVPRSRLVVAVLLLQSAAELFVGVVAHILLGGIGPPDEPLVPSDYRAIGVEIGSARTALLILGLIGVIAAVDRLLRPTTQLTPVAIAHLAAAIPVLIGGSPLLAASLVLAAALWGAVVIAGCCEAERDRR